MENILSTFPPPEELENKAWIDLSTLEVNGHIHTPFSFSAFDGVGQIFELARKEKVNVLGINDFYTTSGYPEFYEYAVENRVFPLFNIEFIALDRELQQQGIRVNDPNNPGRIYFSGKGLDFPVTMDAAHTAQVEALIRESLRQVRSMNDKLNRVLEEKGSDIRLDFDEIHRTHARELVRERHLAKALRLAVEARYPAESDRLEFLKNLYDGRSPKADPANIAATENEIRNNLLKAGGAAFVEEDEKAFLSVDSVIDLITNAGGIPCYPVLLDDAKGNLTDFEADSESLHKYLKKKGIYCIELIPGRNDPRVMEPFVRFFRQRGFIVLFGTEHNTPEMAPLAVSGRHGVPLSESLVEANRSGATVLAAHEYYRAKGIPSPVSDWNNAKPETRISTFTDGMHVLSLFIKR